MAFGGSMVAAALLGRRWRGTSREAELRIAWSTFVVLWQVLGVGYWFLPGNFNLQSSLPLHVCDLAAWLVPLALLARWRWATSMLYFWGIGLSTQAFITPVLGTGPGTAEFWLFWVGHTQIVGSAIYVSALGYRPRPKDVLTAIGLSVIYVGLMLALNIPLGTNYGYVGNAAPEHPTIIDRLGPWPWRLVPLSAIVIGVFVSLWVIWPVWERLTGRPSGGAASDDQRQ